VIMFPPLLLRYLPHLILVILAVAGMAYAVHHIREGVRRELEPQIDRLETELRAERADRARAEAASDAYQSELAGLRTRPTPAAPVRLCRTPSVSGTGQAAQGTDGAAAASGSGPEGSGEGAGEGPGPDIGPDLYALADACDVVAARLRALQGWVAAPSDPTAPRP